MGVRPQPLAEPPCLVITLNSSSLCTFRPSHGLGNFSSFALTVTAGRTLMFSDPPRFRSVYRGPIRYMQDQEIDCGKGGNSNVLHKIFGTPYRARFSPIVLNIVEEAKDAQD